MWRGSQSPRRQRRGKEGGLWNNFAFPRQALRTVAWPVLQRTLALSVGAATWRRHRLWEAGDETGVPPSALLPGGSQRTVSRGKREGQLLLGLVEKPGA